MTSPQPSRALAAIRVLDLTRVRAGPTCVRQFADWGAEVIKIEERVSDEPGGNPADFSARHDPDFQNLHRNKRSLTLDLKSPEGLAILRRLVEQADVLVENYRPDVKHRLGIDYESMRVINPRLVYASIAGFGQDGPYRDRPGVDQIAQGMSGLMSVTGEPGRGPMRVGISLADLSSGLFAALGIMTALIERQTSGEGQWVQTSLLQSQTFLLDYQAARYLMQGEVPGQVGNDHPTGVPTGTFRARDGWVNIAPTPPMWKRFCKAFGREDWIDHPHFASPALRRTHRDELNGLIAERVAAEDRDVWVERLNAAGVPCGPILSIDQTFADPQVQHLGLAQSVHSAALGDITLLGQPVTLSRTPSALVSSAPEAGEHSQAILEELGYDAASITRLREQGVI
jgi:formyl-CoA transferase